MAAQPPRLTDETRRSIIRLVSGGLPVEVAAQLAGVHYATVRHWRAKSRNPRARHPYKGFDAEIQQALAEGEQVNIARVQAAGKNNWRAAAWLLERMNPDRWGPPTPALAPDGPPLQGTPTDDLAGL